MGVGLRDSGPCWPWLGPDLFRRPAPHEGHAGPDGIGHEARKPTPSSKEFARFSADI